MSQRCAGGKGRAALVQVGPVWTIPPGMSTGDSFVERRPRAVAPTVPAEGRDENPATGPAVSVDRAPVARDAPAGSPAAAPRASLRTRTDRLEVCPDCAAFVAGAGDPAARHHPDRREIERGAARLSAPGPRRTTLVATGARLGHRARPCPCCRRPGWGERTVVERTVTEGVEDDEAG